MFFVCCTFVSVFVVWFLVSMAGVPNVVVSNTCCFCSRRKKKLDTCGLRKNNKQTNLLRKPDKGTPFNGVVVAHVCFHML